MALVRLLQEFHPLRLQPAPQLADGNGFLGTNILPNVRAKGDRLGYRSPPEAR